jgi:O-antigen/teichoic acid export membrane protein
MGIVGKQTIKGSIYIYFGVIIGFVSSGVLMPKLLSSEGIGLIKLLTSYSILFGQLATLGFVPATTKMFPKFRNKENGHNGFLILSLFVGIIGFIIMFIAFILLKDLIVSKTQTSDIDFNKYIYLVLIIGGFTSFFLIIDAYTRALFYTSAGLFLKDFIQKALNLVIIVFYGLNFYNFDVFLILFTAINCIPTLLLFIYLLFKKELKFIPNFRFLDKDIVKSILNVSLFGIISSFSGILVINIDSIMISTFLGMDAAGIYATVFYFAFVITIPYRSMERVSAAVISEFWNQNNITGIFEVYKKSCVNQAIVALFLFIMIWSNEHNIFKFLPQEFSEGRYVILILGVGNFINMASGVNNSIIGTSNFYRFQTYIQIMLVVLLVTTNYIFIPLWGIVGAAFASFLSMFVLNLLKYLFIIHKFQMQPFDKIFIQILLIGFALILINYFLPKFDNLYLDGFYRSIILSSLYVILTFKLKVSAEINSVIETVLKRFKLFS